MMCEYCEGRKKFKAVYKGDGLLTMGNALDVLLGSRGKGGFEVARIDRGMMLVDNSSGEYAELGFKINYCPNCGASMVRGEEDDTFSFTLESPLTEEQINLITDAEFEHTDRIWFDTPKGKHIEFVKAPQWIPCSERVPEDGKWCLFTDGENMSIERYKLDAIDHFFPNGRWFEFDDAVAWMPLPEPYEERREADG